jgi:gas vesicle protein
MLEKRFSYFLIGLATGAGALALFAPKSGRVYRGKKMLAKSGTKVRRSATDLISRGKGSLKHVNGAFKGAMEAGRTAFSVH